MQSVATQQQQQQQSFRGGGRGFHTNPRGNRSGGRGEDTEEEGVVDPLTNPVRLILMT